MSTLTQSTIPAAKPVAKELSWFSSNWGLLAAIAALVVVLLLPTPAGLPVAGHRMLAILAFAVIVWMTEAIDYAVSAIVIAALMAFLLGLAPSVANPKVLMGTSAALDARLRRLRQHRAGAGRRRAVPRRRHDRDRPRQAHRAHHPLARRHRNPPCRDRHHPGRLRASRFMVPSTTARVACLVPITLGIIAAFGVNKTRRLRQHADDHHGADRQHLERRHQDRGGAEHGRHRLHREDLQPDDHLARLADRRRAVRHPDVDRALFRDDPDDAAGSGGGPRRPRGHPQIARRARTDEGLRDGSCW